LSFSSSLVRSPRASRAVGCTPACRLTSCAAPRKFAALLKVWLGGPRGDAVLLVGPCDAGKTTLFLQLRDRSVHGGTVASMSVNEAAVKLRGDKVPRVVLPHPCSPIFAASRFSSRCDEAHPRPAGAMQPGARPACVVDIPGHPRLRKRLFDQAVPSARGIVFVLDAVDFMPPLAETAE
jgi:signal recognition particle receptor subunit beta